MQKQKKIHNTIEPRILSAANNHQNQPGALLEIFQEFQETDGGISKSTIQAISQSLQEPPHHAFGVATFYSMLNLIPHEGDVIRVCDGPVCWLCGGEELHKKIQANLTPKKGWRVERTSCLGLCDRAPAALMNDQQVGPIPIQQTNKLTRQFTGVPRDYSQPRQGETRVMLAHAGLVDPATLVSALKYGAYQAFKAALSSTPENILSVVEASGLTGRGGAGFPVGRKWRFVFQATRTPKYIICNADESEPLIFKDRVLIDTNPHQILEGMAIAGFACGASEAFIYIRGEYEYQARRLENAIAQAEAQGWLGKDIQGTGYSLHIHVHRGAGAYICGEETALIESLEGRRGEPRLRPPYPPSAGYLGLPTLVNNVESYAAVPSIVRNSAKWYRTLSTASTPGTKLYMLLGHVNQPGLFEAPFGLTLRQVIEDFGGGMRSGAQFHFALTGGAAGTIVPPGLMDVPIDYASSAKGVSLGAGAFLVCDQTVSLVALLRNLMNFFTLESCGKCTPCRVGTYRSREILDLILESKGQNGFIEELYALADNMGDASFCGLGQSAVIPMRSALTHFEQSFRSMINA